MRRRDGAARVAPPRRPERAGFTLLEVMIAVGLMTVGALAIMAMQQAATRGNVEARQIGTATEITSRWIERLRRETLRWNAVGTSPADLGDGGLLAALVGPMNEDDPDDETDNVAWQAIPVDGTLTGDIGPAFDWTGLPVPNVAPDEDDPTDAVRYCTYVQLTWVREGSLMRADVLTWWHRRGAGGDVAISNPSAFHCATSSPSAVVADLADPETTLKSVRASTLLRWTYRGR